MCVVVSEGAAGSVALTLAPVSPASLPREQDAPGEQRTEELEDEPLPLPLPAGGQGVRGHHAAGTELQTLQPRSIAGLETHASPAVRSPGFQNSPCLGMLLERPCARNGGSC